jgi:hypothetical protein
MRVSLVTAERITFYMDGGVYEEYRYYGWTNYRG